MKWSVKGYYKPTNEYDEEDPIWDDVEIDDDSVITEYDAVLLAQEETRGSSFIPQYAYLEDSGLRVSDLHVGSILMDVNDERHQVIRFEDKGNHVLWIVSKYFDEFGNLMPGENHMLESELKWERLVGGFNDLNQSKI